MSFLYLTPASISYLNQSLLALLLTLYIGRRYFILRHQRPSVQDRLLFSFFIAVSLFSFLLFLDVSLLPAERLYIVYSENFVLGILLVVLIQFAYYFPVPNERQKIERWVLLILSIAYVLWEAGFAIWRYHLLGLGQVEFRPPNADNPVILGFVWTMIVFARGAIKNWQLPASRQFALIFLVPIWLAWLNIERTNYQISTPFFYINMSVGILLTLFLFALIFLTSQPEKTSFAAKFGGVMLTSMLAVFGIVGWLIAPSYAERYSPNIPDHRTLQYAPNEQGGYDVSEIPFRFDPDLGQDIGSTISYADRTFVMGVNFDFPYFGNQYETIYISNTGAVSMGESLDWKNLQFHFSNIPAILALLVDFDPGKCTDCGIYIREDPGQLVVTYLKVPSLNHLSATYTFQIILHSNGSFNVTYNGLPEDLKFYVDDRPEATVWAIGIKPAIAPSLSVDLSDLPVQSNADGLIQDEYRAFRDYLNAFLRPVAIAILAGSLLVLIILFAVFRYGLAQPLDALLKGVQTFNSGGRDVAIPVKFNDEIGFLTESFNNLSGELNDMITGLEDRISARTSELVTANDQLRKLSIAVEQSPSTIIITDTKARIEYVNSSFTLSTGYTFEEVKGKNPRILKSGLTPPETYKEMWDTILSGRTWRGELINRKKDGNNFWEFTVVAPIYNQNGQVTHYVAVKEDTTERRHAEQELERLAITDPLTGLSNRRYFFTQAELFFIHANQPPFILSALMIDFDHFKHINDQYGHATGDIVLSESARRMQANLRPSDVIGRYGGDELVILLPRTSSSKANQIAERLCAIISKDPITVGDKNISITVSVGVANMDEHIPTLEILLQRADEAMYAAKQAGRNCCVAWQSRPADLSS